jgi:hypothetical protein
LHSLIYEINVSFSAEDEQEAEKRFVKCLKVENPKLYFKSEESW